jgi:hypothetical protein
MTNYVFFFADTLLVLYPGEYVLGSALFLLTLFVLKRDIAYIQSRIDANTTINGDNKDNPINLEVVTMDKTNPNPSHLDEKDKEQTKM